MVLFLTTVFLVAERWGSVERPTLPPSAAADLSGNTPGEPGAEGTAVQEPGVEGAGGEGTNPGLEGAGGEGTHADAGGASGGEDCTAEAVLGDSRPSTEVEISIGVPRCRDGFAVAIAGDPDSAERPMLVAFEHTEAGWTEIGRVGLSECSTLRELEPSFPTELC